MKTYYQAITRDKNSWGLSGLGEITWDCGHKHRTPEAAYKCLVNMGDALCCYHAVIEGSDGTTYDRIDFCNLDYNKI